MEMERTRRSVDRTRELAVKKPRLADDADRDRDRAAAALPSRERPAIPRGGGASADPRFRASERQREEAAKGGGGGYQPQPPQQQQMQELVAEYKTALAELTFNSKPIITNLTIIAGENIHAAKVIAATICAHILEVPSDQKLPSLYLLDSIVKNIGRDYIKYFAARLPEVFCKAYRQVDPSIHSGMKHLYGTWKGVFPPTPLQLIEKELFATAVNNSSSRTDASNASQTRPSHSIHVNPKYLEARQRLQQSSHPKVTNNDSRDSSINSAEDLDRPDRTSSSGNTRSWVDASPDTQNNQYPLREGSETSRKSSILVDRNLEYESDIPQYPDLKIGRTSKAVMGMERPGIDGSLYPTSRPSLETSVEQRNGFDYPLAKYKEARPSQILQQLPSTQTGILRGNQVSSRSWKNSEEEEYMWDDMGSKFADHAEKNDTWKRERNFEDPQKQANVGRSKWNETYWNKFDNSQLEKSSGDERFPTVMEFDEKPSFSRKQSDGRLMARRESYPDSMYTEEAIPRARNPSAILHQESLPAVSFTQSSVFSRLSCQSESHQAPLSTGLSVSFKSSLSNEGLNPSSLGISSSSSTLQSNAPFQHMKTRIPSLDHQHSQLDSQNNQTQMPISGQLDQPLLSKFAPEVFQPRTSSRIQPPQINPQPTAFRNSQSGETSLPYTPYETQNRPSVQHQSHYEQLLPPKESKPQLAGETGRQLSLGMSSKIGGSLAPSNSSSETGNTSNAAELLAAIMKSKHVSSNATGDLHNPNPQLPLPGGPPPMPTVLPSISVLRSTTDSVPSSSCNNSLSLEVPRTVNPPLPPGPPPHSSIVVQLANSMDTNLNPLSSLLSSLVAKGIITSQGNQTQLKDGPECDGGVQMLNKLPFKTSNFSASNPGNAVSTVDTLPVASSSNELSPVEEVVVVSKQQTEDLKDLIGFEFRPDIIRSLHDTVINALFDDMKHQCRKCGLRFRLQDKLDEHMHSHDLRRLGVTSQASQKWFPSLTEFLSGCLSRHSDSLNSSAPVEIALDSAGSEPMVPADESQCICAFCAEPFEDVYCLVKNIWMYKGTVYMKPAVGMQNVRGLDSDKKSALIVHVKCMPERLKEGL